MNNWVSRETAPEGITQVLLWIPYDRTRPFDEGDVIMGGYERGHGFYYDANGDEIDPVAWQPCPRGPRSPKDFWNGWEAN